MCATRSSIRKKKPPGKVNDSTAPVFPTLSFPSALSLQRLDLPGLITVPGFFSPRDCSAILQIFSSPGILQPPRAPAKDEATRTNWRWSGQNRLFAGAVLQRFGSLLDELEGGNGTRGKALNPNIRVYRYEKGQSFGKHYDDSVFVDGLRSEWTLLIYLTGVEDGVEGGETVFYPEARALSKRASDTCLDVRVGVRRGMALLHRHGRECALHEGAPVLKGTKWVLRSDVLFGKA